MMSPEPLVSFVMSARQPRRDWFEAAVNSALSQENCELELLVVDDGSPEPVERLLQGIDDPRLRVIRVDHGGISHARNAGIAEATGEHFRFIDADDVLEPGSTARLVRLAGEEPGGAVAYGATRNSAGRAWSEGAGPSCCECAPGPTARSKRAAPLSSRRCAKRSRWTDPGPPRTCCAAPRAPAGARCPWRGERRSRARAPEPS